VLLTAGVRVHRPTSNPSSSVPVVLYTELAQTSASHITGEQQRKHNNRLEFERRTVLERSSAVKEWARGDYVSGRYLQKGKCVMNPVSIPITVRGGHLQGQEGYCHHSEEQDLLSHNGLGVDGLQRFLVLLYAPQAPKYFMHVCLLLTL